MNHLSFILGSRQCLSKNIYRILFIFFVYKTFVEIQFSSHELVVEHIEYSGLITKNFKLVFVFLASAIKFRILRKTTLNPIFCFVLRDFVGKLKEKIL